MSGDADNSNKKWNIVREQLISLCALNKLSKGNEDFIKLFSEDLSIKGINSHILTSICYFVLGIINLEERDKLIRWPLINIQTQTKFRKGVSSLITTFQEKYPWANLKKLPESYFMNPRGYHTRIVDFIIRLTNLAIHLSLNDPTLLLLHPGEGLNIREISIMTEIVSNAREHEEKLMNNNLFSITEFEDTKNVICDKCIALKHQNDDLQQQVSSLIKHAISEGVVSGEDKIEVEDLRKIKDEKLTELSNINVELGKYFEVSQELLSKIKAAKNPMSLSSQDFGCRSSPPDITHSTKRVCGDLYELFQQINSKKSSKEDEDHFYDQLKLAKKALVEEQKAIQSFLAEMAPYCPKS